jgi:hypothetical protein
MQQGGESICKFKTEGKNAPDELGLGGTKSSEYQNGRDARRRRRRRRSMEQATGGGA